MVVALEPPPAPVITEPVNASVITAAPLVVVGTAEPFVEVRLTRNGTVLGTCYVGGNTCTSSDDCNKDPYGWNYCTIGDAKQLDQDGDDLGDVCDNCRIDSDQDGYGNPNMVENGGCAEDNCPDDYNPDQEDICSGS